MAKAGIRRSQAPNLCHAEAKTGAERDISSPRCRHLTSRPSTRTVAPKSGQSPGAVFTQPGPEAGISERPVRRWKCTIRRGLERHQHQELAANRNGGHNEPDELHAPL